MTDFWTPDSLTAWALGVMFGSPSLVVSTFLLFNAVWAWGGLAKDAVTVATVVVDRASAGWKGPSLRRSATWRTGVAWVSLYVPASLVTQIWAGAYSRSMGGGLAELVGWAALFGGVALVACVVLVPRRGPRFGDPRWVPLWGLMGGYVGGALWAVIAFSVKGGPQRGDWWVCPAMSCVGVVGSCLRMRIKAVKSRAGE